MATKKIKYQTMAHESQKNLFDNFGKTEENKMAYKEVVLDEEVNFFNFAKVGTVLEGKYLSVKDSEKYGKIFTILSEGKEYLVCGKTQLNQLMAKVELNSKVRITYTQEVPAGKNKMKIFRVEVDEDDIDGDIIPLSEEELILEENNISTVEE